MFGSPCGSPVLFFTRLSYPILQYSDWWNLLGDALFAIYDPNTKLTLALSLSLTLTLTLRPPLRSGHCHSYLIKSIVTRQRQVPLVTNKHRHSPLLMPTLLPPQMDYVLVRISGSWEEFSADMHQARLAYSSKDKKMYFKK